MAGIRAIWPSGRGHIVTPAQGLALLRECVQLLLTHSEQVGPACGAGPPGLLIAGPHSTALILLRAFRLLSSAVTKVFRLVST